MGLVSSLPAQPPRRRMTKQDRRAQLLERAQAMFASHGFHHITMDEIAVAAQVSKPVLYRHFPSKRDLYLATIDDRKCALLRAVDDALDQSDIFNSPTAAPDLRHHRHDGAHDTSNTIGLATVRAIMRAYVEFAEQSGAVPPFSSNLTSPVMTISGKKFRNRQSLSPTVLPLDSPISQSSATTKPSPSHGVRPRWPVTQQSMFCITQQPHSTGRSTSTCLHVSPGMASQECYAVRERLPRRQSRRSHPLKMAKTVGAHQQEATH